MQTETASPDMFSSQVQDALSKLSTRFSSDINEAFQTDPATKERAKEAKSLSKNTLATLASKKQVLEENERAIMHDMEILHQSKTLGSSPAFTGFAILGTDDYLGNYLGDSDDSDSSYDSDNSSDSDDDDDDDSVYDASVCPSYAGRTTRGGRLENVESGSESEDESDDESDYDDSEYDSEDYDSGDDSSLGSYDDLMSEMQNQMGVILPDELKLKTKGRVTMDSCASMVSVDNESFMRQGSVMSLDTMK